MTRWWNEFVAGAGDVVPLPLLLILLFLAATLVAALWYLYPAWVPRRWPRLRWSWLRWRAWRWPKLRWPKLRWPKLRWPRRRKPAPAELAAVPEFAADSVPELPAADFTDLADRLAAEGRYAEAVRERLRGMVRQLIERGVLDHRPGWTVTELAAIAASRRPGVAGPLDEAALIFSDIWYGERPAGREQDARMRQLADALTAILRQAAPAPAGATR